MNLGYAQNINGKETLFVERILRGIDRMPDRMRCLPEYLMALKAIGYEFKTDQYWFGNWAIEKQLQYQPHQSE